MKIRRPVGVEIQGLKKSLESPAPKGIPAKKATMCVSYLIGQGFQRFGEIESCIFYVKYRGVSEMVAQSLATIGLWQPALARYNNPYQGLKRLLGAKTSLGTTLQGTIIPTRD